MPATLLHIYSRSGRHVITFLLIGVLVFTSSSLHSRAGTFGDCDVDVNALFDSLTSVDRFRANRAKELIYTNESWPESVIPSLIERLSDDRSTDWSPSIRGYSGPPIRDYATDILVKIGKPAVAALGEVIAREGDTESQIQAIKVLAMIGSDARESIPALRACTRGADEWTRYFAVDALSKIAGDPSEVIPVLLQSLDDGSPEVQSAAIRGLGVIGPNAANVLPRLLDLLNTREFRRVNQCSFMPVRADIAEAIGRIGNRDSTAIEELVKLLSDEEPQVRIAASLAYCRLSDDTDRGLAVLTEQLWSSSRGDSIPYRAAIALGELNNRAAPVAGEIIRALKHEKPLVRAEVVKTIAAVLPDTYVELVLPMLNDEDSLVRESVIETLGKDDLRNVQYVHLFIKALDDRTLMTVALNALGDMGSKAADAIPRLEIMAASDDQWDRRRAKAALKQIRDDMAKAHREQGTAPHAEQEVQREHDP